MSEHEKKLWESSLNSGEVLLWTGRPLELKMIDPANPKAVWIPFGFALIWAAVTMGFLGNQINGISSLLIMELPAIIGVLIPFMYTGSLRKTAYAITNRRVIIKGGNNDASMEYDCNIKVEKRPNQTVCIGAATGIRPAMERHCLLFHGIQDDTNKKCLGLVLYSTTDADRAVEILKKGQ